MTLEELPLSTFGGDVLVLPREDILLSALAIGPSGTPTSNDVGKAFDGVMMVGSGKLTVKPFGLVGHQSLGFTWNNKERFSLDQDPSNIARLLLDQQFPSWQTRPGLDANPRKPVPEPAGPDPTRQSHE
jgi:porin